MVLVGGSGSGGERLLQLGLELLLDGHGALVRLLEGEARQYGATRLEFQGQLVELVDVVAREVDALRRQDRRLLVADALDLLHGSRFGRQVDDVDVDDAAREQTDVQCVALDAVWLCVNRDCHVCFL